MNKIAKIPTLIAVLFLVLGTAGGIVLVNREAIFNLGAAPESSPKDVRITNITDNSFTVTWITDKPASGFVKWGETSTLGQTLQPDEGTKNTSTHLATVKGLAKNKKYYFSINSGGKDFTLNGIPWDTQTLTAAPVGSVKISGTILGVSGESLNDAIVYVDTPGILQQSTKPSNSGNWVLSLPTQADPAATLLNVYVQGGASGIATAEVYLAGANPMPAIQLGKTYDFKSVAPTTVSSVPDSFVTLPEGGTQNANSGAGASRFELSTKATPTTNGTLTIENVKDGETVYSKRPEFFGKAPANTTITVEVHSTAVVKQTLKADTTGAWKWSPSTPLEDGTHTMTISWKDSSGIVQTITRNFSIIANAAEPSFESTPSGTNTPFPTSTATATPSPTPTATVKPTATATASATPLATAKTTFTPEPTEKPATDSGSLPNAGIPLATVSILALGASLILGGLFFGLSMSSN